MRHCARKFTSQTAIGATVGQEVRRETAVVGVGQEERHEAAIVSSAAYFPPPSPFQHSLRVWPPSISPPSGTSLPSVTTGDGSTWLLKDLGGKLFFPPLNKLSSRARLLEES